MERDDLRCAGQCGEQPRRRFLTVLCLGIGGIGGALLALPAAGLLLLPLRRRKPAVWRDIGPLDDYEPGQTVKAKFVDPEPLPWAGPAAESAAWVRRVDEERLVAFGAYCTHVGCPVRWVEGARLFLCPCHGGAFHEDGSVAGGPPPRPLPRHDVRVRDGRVEIRSLAIQEALGASGRRG
jgi:menaquinol-cytochrome c reductase iron-sulfur subunit